METIFVVATIRRNCQSRTIGWYSNFEEAEKAILEDHCNLWEDGYWHYASIEEVTFGVYPIPPKSEQWYRNRNEKIIKVDKPERFKIVVNFSIG